MQWYQATGQAPTMRQQVREAVAAMARLGDGVKVRRVAGPPETEAGVPVRVTSREWPTPPEGARFGPGEMVGELHEPDFSVEGVASRPDPDRPEIYSDTMDGGYEVEFPERVVKGGPPFIAADPPWEIRSRFPRRVPRSEMFDPFSPVVRRGPGEMVEEFPSEYVDIYLSAGPFVPMEDYPSCSRQSCEASNKGTCEIYRVRWDLAAGTWVSVEQVTDEPGSPSFQPALSPSGRSVAWVHRPDNVATNDEIAVSDTVGGTAFTLVDAAAIGATGLHFPNWYSDDEVVFHPWGDSEEGQIGIANVSSSSTTFFPEEPQTPDVDDPHTSQAPSHGGHGGAAPLIVAQRDYTVVDGRALVRPVVFSLDDAGFEEVEEFELEFPEWLDLELYTSGGDRKTGLEGCHHPAWNPAGDRIQCSAQQDDFDAGTGVMWGGSHTRMLYEFYFDVGSNEWSCAGLLFEPLTPEELGNQFPDVFPTSDHARYRYTYKYSEWCGSEDYVIATVYVEDAVGEGCPLGDDRDALDVIVSSRVMLIHLTDDGVQYHDITAAVEEGLVKREWGDIKGRLRSAFSTCSKPFAH